MYTCHFLNISSLLKYCMAVFLLTTLYACQPSTVYYSYEVVPAEGWRKCDTLNFILPDTLTPKTYHMEIGLRHSGKYPYRDIWLELTQYIPSESKPKEWKERKDTIHIYLANEKGKWNSTGTTGGYYQLLSPAGSLTIYPNRSAQEWVAETAENKDTVVTTKENKPANDFIHAKKNKYTFDGQQHKINKQDRLYLKMTHIMTDSILLNISDVGIKLSEM